MGKIQQERGWTRLTGQHNGVLITQWSVNQMLATHRYFGQGTMIKN